MTGKVIVDISVSTDGFVTAANPTADEPTGSGGLRLVEWFSDTDDEQNAEVIERGSTGGGAIIAGRRTYDTSLPWWGADGPTGPARRPVVVLTHEAPQDSPG